MAGAVRQQIDKEKLEQYLQRHVSTIKTPIDIKQFGFGQSNPTYLLQTADNKKFVLRKQPPGQLISKTAHRVDREHKIIHALEATDVPVPKTHGLCMDASVIGSAFYIMEFLDGRIFEEAHMPGVNARERRALWRAAIDTLAKLHRVEPQSIGLEGFGKASGFYDRQMATFSALADKQGDTVDVESQIAVGPIPHSLELIQFFKDRRSQPKDRATLIHGDFKIDNVVFHKTEPTVIGILDWEMATIGHPLSDLCCLLEPFTISARTKALRRNSNPAFRPSKLLDGLPSRQQCVEWYAQSAGWNPRKEIAWGSAFAMYRNCVIYQGIAARFATRQASSAQAKEVGQEMYPAAAIARGLVEEVQDYVSRASL